MSVQNLKYLAIDTETGGLADTSLLTVFLGVYDSNFNLIDSKHEALKPDDGVYHVTAGGLSVNGINLVELDAKAKLRKVLRSEITGWLRQHSDQGANKLIPIGHNVKFDILAIQESITSQESWDHYVSYRVLDTGVIAQYLKYINILPDSISGSLGSLIEFFGITVEGELHTADADAKMTVEVFKKLAELGRK